MPVMRDAKALWLRFIRRRTLSQKFLLTAALVVALAMAGLGFWISHLVQVGITRGVAQTAAASIDSLLSHNVAALGLDEPFSSAERRELDRMFAEAADTEATPLYNIRIRNRAGETIYVSDPDFEDDDDRSGDYAFALAGGVRARLLSVTLAAVGSLPNFPVAVLEIYAPVRSGSQILGVAELYFSAEAVTRLRDEAQRLVWMVVGLTGVIVVALLYLIVDRATAVIARQRWRLGNQLATSQRLSAENFALGQAAEDLRRHAITANEALLAQVGSDIHDGPLQLLTTTILRLASADESLRKSAVDMIGEIMEDLRKISSGLVLPELATANLRTAIALAVKRHGDLTGTRVEQLVDVPDGPISLSLKVVTYRVVQEALSNAYRHAGGRGQRVHASAVGAALTLIIENHAIDAVEPVIDDSRLGIRGMRLRVESVGGELSIAFDPPVTRVRAWMPLDSEKWPD